MRLCSVVNSSELGLAPGTIQDVDAAVQAFNREQLLLRSVAVIHALSRDRQSGIQDVNLHYADGALSGELRARVRALILSGEGRFLNPLQQMSILRRALSVSEPIPGLNFGSKEGLQKYFDLCRFATDVSAKEEKFDDAESKVQQWIKVAAGLSMALWFSNSPNPNHAIGRMRLMLERMPQLYPSLQKHAQALKNRFPETIGISYEDATALSAFLAYWTRTNTWLQVFEEPGRIRLNPETWLRETNISKETFAKFLERTGRDSTEVVPSEGIGGPLSLLPLKDRPFLKFRDGTVAAVSPELVAEKLTSDIFWWVKNPDLPQEEPWQQDWGQVGEGYVLWLLEQTAKSSNCEFLRNVKWEGGELDAAIWFKGHIALIEVTSSSVPDPVAFSGDWEKFRDGLHQAYVQSKRKDKPPYNEAILQLARDIQRLQTGQFVEIPVPNVQRIYPVLIALDRKLRVPGAWHYLNEQLSNALGEGRAGCAALAPINLEDLEALEQLLYERPKDFRGTPPGLLRVLRRWDYDRGVGPSWWQFMNYAAGRLPPSRHLQKESDQWMADLKGFFASEGAGPEPA